MSFPRSLFPDVTRINHGWQVRRHTGRHHDIDTELVEARYVVVGVGNERSEDTTIDDFGIDWFEPRVGMGMEIVELLEERDGRG